MRRMTMRRAFSRAPGLLGSRALFALAAVVGALACASTAGSTTATAPAQPAAPYRILISNDDGVRAPGILAVAKALQSLGEVTIVAPAENQSGKGHSITISEPIFRSEVMLDGLRATSLTATPASTVKVALANIVKNKPDLVVSGINRGYNLGLSAYLSGTVGAAREAASQGIPAIAASLSMPATDYSAAADATVRIARHVKESGLPAGVFLNVNIPTGTTQTLKGLMIATQSMSSGGVEAFAEQKHPDGRTLYWNVYKEGGTDAQGTDMWAVEQGYVAVTPLKVGEYDAASAARLKTLTTARQ
jgi:5'/3'-nucleotidase